MAEFDWLKAEEGAEVPSTEGGASGFFSAPSKELDPHLFDGDTMKEDVRRWLCHELDAFMKSHGFRAPVSWLRIWVAGSGITYQWDAGRGNGDLDVLFGVDLQLFAYSNPDWAHLNDADLSSTLNEMLRTELWPLTSAHDFNGQVYEVTFYVNPGMGTDIRHIHPYAAYDLVENEWTVRPPELPEDPHTLYPDQWFEWAGYDKQATDELVRGYNAHTATLKASVSGSAQYHSAGSQLNLVTAQADALFGEIHHGRREAFQGVGGAGYGDWHNFRWQAAKESGVVKALMGIVAVRHAAQDEQEQELYGGHLAGADELVRRAAMNYKDRT